MKTSKSNSKESSKTKKQKTELWEFKQKSKKDSKIQKFMVENEIAVTNLQNKPVEITPILKFSDVEFPAQLEQDLQRFKKPTPIQSVSWPLLFQGKDLVGIAKTGSGKTMAFGLPGLLHIRNSEPSNKPRVLVLSPTRELAIQIEEQFILFGTTSNLRSVCIYGGIPKHEQKQKLKLGMDAIIATPGRLIDLFEEDSDVCDLSQVNYLVLDEADRMLDQGFEPAIRKILAKLAPTRQTVMFSATWPQSIRKLAGEFLSNSIKITVGSDDLSANEMIEQRVEVLDPKGKERRLQQLLKEYHNGKNRIIIFALYKKEASRLEQQINRWGYACCGIHGDMSQPARTQSLESFKKGKTPLMVATDVAARGIDIPNVEYVINVTFPLTVEDYCHRIGRTGRAGKTGISHTFFTVQDKSHSGALINVLKQAGQTVPPELLKFGTTVKKKVDPNYGVFARDVDMSIKGTKITFDD